MSKKQRPLFKLSLASSITGLIFLGFTIGAQAFTGQEFAKDAKISTEQARAAATKALPGKIVDEELEKGKGGSLHYSFDIIAGHTRQEVWVDAMTGEVQRIAK